MKSFCFKLANIKNVVQQAWDLMDKQQMLRFPQEERTSVDENPFAWLEGYKYQQGEFRLFLDNEIQSQAGISSKPINMTANESGSQMQSKHPLSLQPVPPQTGQSRPSSTKIQQRLNLPGVQLRSPHVQISKTSSPHKCQYMPVLLRPMSPSEMDKRSPGDQGTWDSHINDDEMDEDREGKPLIHTLHSHREAKSINLGTWNLSDQQKQQESHLRDMMSPSHASMSSEEDTGGKGA